MSDHDIYHSETYTHKNGKQYDVKWYYDHDCGAPQLESDCHGVIEHMSWDPTDDEELTQHIEDYELDLAEEIRLSLMRKIKSDQYRQSNLYYDVLSSLQKARDDWGITDPMGAMQAVEKDFAHISGWYNDDWCWVTLGVAPLDENGEPMEEDREYCGGYESTIIDRENKDWHDEAVEDKIGEVERVLYKRLHKDQMELDLA